MHDWFHFADKDDPPYNPIADPIITVERLLENEASKFEEPDWTREEWLLRSALVPLHQLHEAAARVPYPDYFRFSAGWDTNNTFNFGEGSYIGDIQLFPIVQFWNHPITGDSRIELTPRFVLYHALQKRTPTQYFHPIDDILVAETTINQHELFDNSGQVEIHSDYLRDFLAAVEMGLIISIVADRFANAETEKVLEIEEIDHHQIDELTWISMDIHPPEFTHHPFFRGRSILHRNIIIEPYERPRFHRSPWPFFGDDLYQVDEYPHFIINSEGERRTLPRDTILHTYQTEGIGEFGYLWFKPDVLQKYLTTPGHTAHFHMRNWGAVSLPGNRGSIDVGINSQGMVTAFGPNIADLTPPEQAYWASYTSLPSGEICEEMFQTRMLLQPPHSPGAIDLIRGTSTKLGNVFQREYGQSLYTDWEPENQDRNKLSIGPISGKYSEVLNLAKSLYSWIIEQMQIDSLREVLVQCGGSVTLDLRQIKLLERILMAKGLAKEEARSITAPLAGLNDLRVSSAHAKGPALDTSFQLFGVEGAPESPRDGWNLCIDSVVEAINRIAEVLEE